METVTQERVKRKYPGRGLEGYLLLLLVIIGLTMVFRDQIAGFFEPSPAQLMLEGVDYPTHYN